MISDFMNWDEPVSIKQLEKMTGQNNRNVRKMIEAEREMIKDFVIISSSHATGYFKTRDRQKVVNFKLEQERRAKKILFNLRNANAFIENYGQLELEIKND